MWKSVYVYEWSTFESYLYVEVNLWIYKQLPIILCLTKIQNEIEHVRVKITRDSNNRTNSTLTKFIYTSVYLRFLQQQHHIYKLIHSISMFLEKLKFILQLMLLISICRYWTICPYKWPYILPNSYTVSTPSSVALLNSNKIFLWSIHSDTYVCLYLWEYKRVCVSL